MTKEWIEQKIKEAHDNAVEKGFYDLCDCNEGQGYNCSLCNNYTGVVQNKNIGELLMLIVSELGEALESHRRGRFADFDDYYLTLDGRSLVEFDKQKIKDECFNDFIKDTFEDEIADVFIRLFDLCGYFGIKPFIDLEYSEIGRNENIGESLVITTCFIMENYPGPNDISISSALSCLYDICIKSNIPIQKNIEAKMAYNKTRAPKHGKEY